MSSVFPAQQVIVIGGGLAGLSAAIRVLQEGGSVLVLESRHLCGGSSTLCMSGINLAGTEVQREKGIQDDGNKLFEDMHCSSDTSPSLAKQMSNGSGHLYGWMRDLGVDLGVIEKLGCCSVPRTHRSKEGGPGFHITYTFLSI